MKSNNAAPGPHETRAILEALIRGLSSPIQAATVYRLTTLGIPNELIDAAVVLPKSEDEAIAAQQAIVDLVKARHSLSEEAAIRVLDGETSVDYEINRQEAA